MKPFAGQWQQLPLENVTLLHGDNQEMETGWVLCSAEPRVLEVHHPRVHLEAIEHRGEAQGLKQGT